MNPLHEIGEHEAIRRLTASLALHPDLVVGAGDDCAVCRLSGTPYDQVFTSDPVIEEVHFKSDDEPRRIGHKALGRALSDLAAMGAEPQWVLVNVVAPSVYNVDRLEQVYEGIRALADRFGATVIGGDLAEGPVFELHVFATGTLPEGSALLRSGAVPGDAIYVTGPLGCSLEGRHLDFIPRVAEGVFLRETEWVHAMMDISDGLATDLRHLMKRSEVGAVLKENLIPRNGSLQQALFDGEDFELLFCVPESRTDELEAAWLDRFGTGLFRMGRITDQQECLSLEAADGSVSLLEKKAFEHFRNPDFR